MRILVLSSSLLVFLLIVPKPAQTQQSTTEEDAEETTTTEKPLSGPEAEFDQCCWDNFVNAQCGLGWCRYPPPVPEPWSPACMVVNNVISAYIPCYAQHKDNTACCVERGVEGKYQVCQDLCNGNATRVSGVMMGKVFGVLEGFKKMWEI